MNKKIQHGTLTLLISILMIGFTGSFAHAAINLNGEWEVQTMGADRKLVIEQNEQNIVLHRVMWPSFEGERYKLEHLFRGAIKGKKITGQLLVREDGAGDYEELRPFDGKISHDNKLIIDGMGIVRVGEAKKSTKQKQNAAIIPQLVEDEAAPISPKPTVLPSTVAPTISLATTTLPPSHTPTEDKPSQASESASLFDSIMGGAGNTELGGLFKISLAVKIPNATHDLISAGDKLYKRKKYTQALKKFRAAQREGGSKGALLAKVGRCYLRLKNYSEAANQLRRALRYDPNSAKLKRDYGRAKRLR